MNNILDKESFVRVMDGIAEVCRYNKRLNDFISDNGEGYVFMPDATVQALDILQIMFEDENDWIGYFFTDMDFGVKYHHGVITSENGNEIPLRNAGDLWELLMRNLKDKYGGD